MTSVIRSSGMWCTSGTGGEPNSRSSFRLSVKNRMALVPHSRNVACCERQSQPVREIRQLVMIHERVDALFRNIKLQNRAAARRNTVRLNAVKRGLSVVHTIQHSSDHVG